MRLLNWGGPGQKTLRDIKAFGRRYPNMAITLISYIKEENVFYPLIHNSRNGPDIKKIDLLAIDDHYVSDSEI